MTIPIPGTALPANKIADELDERFAQMYSALSAWRSRVNTNSATDSLDAESQYRSVTSVRSFVAVRVAANASGIAAAYIRNYPSHQGGSWNATAEWATAKAAIDDFVTFFISIWPKKVTTTGEPAFLRFRADASEELESFSVPVAGAAKTNLLARIDAVLAAFTPV